MVGICSLDGSCHLELFTCVVALPKGSQGVVLCSVVLCSAVTQWEKTVSLLLGEK